MFRGTKLALRRQLGGGRGELIHGRALVHFIKHRAVNHRAAGPDGIVSLPPVKAASVAWDLVERPVVKVGP